MQPKFNFNYPRSITVAVCSDNNYSKYGLLKTDTSGLFKGFVVLMSGMLLVLALSFSINAEPNGPGLGPKPLVTVARVLEQDVNTPSEYVGHVEAVQSVDLRARVEGFLEKVNFKEGSDVHKGELLYIIEQAPYQAKVDADKASVSQAEAILNKARQYLHRAQTVRSGGVSATDLDNAVAEKLRAGAELEQAKANLQISMINLGYTSITAPISGRIGRTALTRGNLVNPGSGPLARIVQIDPVRVVFSISENDLVTVKAALEDTVKDKKHSGLTPRIKLPGGQIFNTVGRIDFVDNTVDPATGTIAVRALFKNPKGLLLPGQYVTVLVSRSRPKLMTVVPQSAVMEDHDGRYVLLVDDQNRVDIRRVRTGSVVGLNWSVESGLTVNDRVIVEGVQKVRPGQIVKTASADEHQGR